VLNESTLAYDLCGKGLAGRRGTFGVESSPASEQNEKSTPISERLGGEIEELCVFSGSVHGRCFFAILCKAGYFGVY